MSYGSKNPRLTSLTTGGAKDASAMVDMTSTTQGLGLPSMTQTQRDAISTPKTGLQIFNSTSGETNVYDGTNWKSTGGGSGEINYIDNGDAEAGTTGWATYDDGAVAAPVDGTGGSPSTLTLTSQGTTVLRGSKSFKLAKSAADGQGEGISYDFTIDVADKNKLLKISFDYNTDLTYTDEDIKVYIYDVTNTTLITPADNGIIGKDKDDGSSGARTIGWASTDSTSYRLIFHQTTTNASTADFYPDNIIVGPGSVAITNEVARTINVDESVVTIVYEKTSGGTSTYTQTANDVRLYATRDSNGLYRLKGTFGATLTSLGAVTQAKATIASVTFAAGQVQAVTTTFLPAISGSMIARTDARLLMCGVDGV